MYDPNGGPIRHFLVVTMWLVFGFSLAGGLAIGLEEWQVATHPVDENADVQSGLLAVSPDGFVTKAAPSK